MIFELLQILSALFLNFRSNSDYILRPFALRANSLIMIKDSAALRALEHCNIIEPELPCFNNLILAIIVTVRAPNHAHHLN